MTPAPCCTKKKGKTPPLEGFLKEGEKYRINLVQGHIERKKWEHSWLRKIAPRR